jgi:release factor glutamine methyltransferase
MAPGEGLAIIRHLLEQAPRYLREGGVICIEHGYQQGPAVFETAQELGYRQIETHRDILGHPRLCWAQI